MFRETGPAKLVAATKAGPLDKDGNPTRVPAARPEYIVMLTPEAFASYNGSLNTYRFTPTYLDDCWAGTGNYDPLQTTVYLKFATKAETESKLKAFLKPADAKPRR